MQAAYILRRFGVFLLIVWLAGTLNFFLTQRQLGFALQREMSFLTVASSLPTWHTHFSYL